MPLDEDEYAVWSTYLDHCEGPEGSPQLACATCNEAAYHEELCCYGHLLWEAMPKHLRDKMPSPDEEGLSS